MSGIFMPVQSSSQQEDKTKIGVWVAQFEQQVTELESIVAHFTRLTFQYFPKQPKEVEEKHAPVVSEDCLESRVFAVIDKLRRLMNSMHDLLAYHQTTM